MTRRTQLEGKERPRAFSSRLGGESRLAAIRALIGRRARVLLLACIFLPAGLGACATSFRSGYKRANSVGCLVDEGHVTPDNFGSLTFYRLPGLGGIHVYLGARLVHTDGIVGECAHDFTLGLSTDRDAKEFEERVARGTVNKDARESFQYTDYYSAVAALNGVTAINNDTTYRKNDMAFYMGILFTPLLGRPCANVVDDIESYLVRHPDL